MAQGLAHDNKNVQRISSERQKKDLHQLYHLSAWLQNIFQFFILSSFHKTMG